MQKWNRWLWALVFGAIFFLSQDYIFTSWPLQTGLFGFPNWLVWFMFVHGLFILVFYFFAKRHWK